MGGRFIDFDPEEHKGRQLYELQNRDEGDSVAAIIVESDATFDEASLAPWYFMVKEDE